MCLHQVARHLVASNGGKDSLQSFYRINWYNRYRLCTGAEGDGVEVMARALGNARPKVNMPGSFLYGGSSDECGSGSGMDGQGWGQGLQEEEGSIFESLSMFAQDE